MRITRSLVLVIALAVAASPAARASCGSASCPIDSNALNLPAPGGWSLDLSFQYIDQDQPRIGTHSAEIGQIPSDHDEVRTLNRTTSLSLHRAVGPSLLFGIVVPYQNRFHEHIAHGEPTEEKHGGGEAGELESWNLDGIGDVLLDAQWRAVSAGRTSLWITGAIELPTGKDDQSNGEEVAEVPIQTGSGSTDVLLGAVVRGSVVRNTAEEGPMGSFAAVPWFISTTFRRNGSGREDYRIGSEWQMNGGTAYPLGRADLMLQLNWRYRQRDDTGTSGEEPELTGGKFLYLSPGVRFVVREPWALYAWVQQPLYQDVNGLQLTAKRNWLFGAQGRF